MWSYENDFVAEHGEEKGRVGIQDESSIVLDEGLSTSPGRSHLVNDERREE